MSTEMKRLSTPKIYLDMENGEFMEFNISIPLQILFDDVVTFVSTTFDD